MPTCFKCGKEDGRANWAWFCPDCCTKQSQDPVGKHKKCRSCGKDFFQPRGYFRTRCDTCRNGPPPVLREETCKRCGCKWTTYQKYCGSYCRTCLESPWYKHEQQVTAIAYKKSAERHEKMERRFLLFVYKTFPEQAKKGRSYRKVRGKNSYRFMFANQKAAVAAWEKRLSDEHDRRVSSRRNKRSKCASASDKSAMKFFAASAMCAAMNVRSANRST